MGDLDDAIREHLELKRRRGADPAEVAREEEEALSPVTRSHPIVTGSPPAESDDEDDARTESEHGGHAEESAQEGPDLGDETQEFRVERLDSSGSWLEDED